ncbi:Pep3/Vps18/deep orange family-domain-containing protein [Diplogelasinospora grovesii]|uniref:Pep3/Vps18/deep orange family-domain-containing protein n=1 Tax=Diplogelasinospora grovesii TaxID=303347 RepID=A0AAN6S4U9_9PEZI|nr:Pep3/Vps18/deep orange family-domain-containing protein [Diplogelasinospora grovesii]
MALNPSDGFVAANNVADLTDGVLPIFDVVPVQLQFSIAADFVAAQVANNVLILALSNGRILRIDLNKPEDIDDIDLPKKPSEVGVIRRMFLDPTASHLIVCTAGGENYYLHSQSRQPRPLARLRGVSIESIAWNPSLPTASTREILIGASDGNIYESYIETSTEFYRKEDKYLKTLQKLPDGPITGLWVDIVPSSGPSRADMRRILISTQSRLYHLVGKIGRHHHDGSASVYTKLFEAEQPIVHELTRSSTAATAASALVVSPDPQDNAAGRPHQQDTLPDRAFAWLSSHGVFHGKLLTNPASPELGTKVFNESKLLPRSQLAVNASEATNGRRKPAAGADYIDALALTQWHVVSLVGSRIIAANRLTGSTIYDQVILDPGQKAIGLCVDIQKSTFWLFTSTEIFEIVVRDEDRDIWKIMLQMQQFDAALQYAHTPAQRDAVATASGDYLTSKGLYSEAATVYGKSSKPFEEVALSFIDNNQPDALRKYLLAKLSTYKKAAVMQRIMIATWLVEIFMAKLNSLDDTIITKAELSDALDPTQTKEQLDAVRNEYHDFVNKHKSDLDRKTVYDVISSHGREEELLYYANAINDHNFVLSYWVQRERWSEALTVLKRQKDAEVFYRYSSVLMTHAAGELVDILMRQSTNLKPRNLIPALLEYDRNYTGPLSQNQAIRYLLYVVNQLGSTDSAVHNTLVSIYASHPSRDESALLSYLESQGDEPKFDPDFALRLCIQNHRVLSCAHIYTSMGQYVQAVDLALSHDEIELASIIADRPIQSGNAQLRKKLWLAIAKKVIGSGHIPKENGANGTGVNGVVVGGDKSGIKTAIEFLKRCDLLRIEDLIPFFPDFVVIDDFKEEICAALEEYSKNIDSLRREMDESSQTAANIRIDISRLDQRYAIVEPGEKCFVCGLPLLSRQFFVFPCQHAFHSDCLGRKVLEQAGPAKSRRIKECQIQISKGLVSGTKREAMIAELDSLVASACILCSDYAIKRIDEPFVKDGEDRTEWSL